MTNTTTFSPITTKDIDILVSLMQEFYAIDHYPFSAEKSKQLFQTFINNKNLGKAWLIYHNSEAVGYLILTFVFSFEYGGTIAFLDELYLTESARGKGIGKQAIVFMQQEALKLKLKIIYLEVETHNEKAQKLYLSHNFVVHHRKLLQYTVK